MISGAGTLLAPPQRGALDKSPHCNFAFKGERPSSQQGLRRQESHEGERGERGERPSSQQALRRQDSPMQSPVRLRSSKATVVRREELKCLEMVLERCCRKEDRVSAYLRRAHNVEAAGKERLFCFDGPDEHIRKALLSQDPPWVENQMVTSKIFHLKWTLSDCEDDYRYLQEGSLFNHFQRNRELTTKVGLTYNLRRFSCEGTMDVDRFFPRSYDMNSASEVQDFVLDFRRCAALQVLRQHLRLARWAQERQRMMEHMTMDGVVEGSCYVCNVNVLRMSLRALLRWLEDLDGTFFEDEQVQGRRQHLFSEEWDAVVCYSELSDAQLCGDDGEERKRKQRGCFSASGTMRAPRDTGGGSSALRGENHQKWPEFDQHHWGEAPEALRQQAEESLKLLEARWPQIWTQGPMNVWVVKPGTGSKGCGVLCMDSLPEVLHHCKTTSNRIVQKYIERPLLLFSGRKFDLRQWVLVRSFQPLKVYMFSSCYLRLCNEPYDLGDLDNRQRHISNWSVNKRGKHVSDGAVASLDEFQEVLEMMTGRGRSYWEEELIPQLKTCIVQTLQAVQPNILQRSECFEVYGFDFLISEDLKPWLLEVNLSPACESRTAWMSEMLERMASRLVELLIQGHLPPDGLQPDWLLICDEAPVESELAMSPSAPSCGEEIRGKDMDLADTWGRASALTVLGKSVSRRFLRRLDHIWRRNEAQRGIAAAWRGWRLRRQMKEERLRMAQLVFHRSRQRAWLNMLRRALFQQRRRPAAEMILAATRGFLCRHGLWQVRRHQEALCIQRSWRGHLGRRRAHSLRRLRCCLRLQRWWRGAQLRQRLVAKGRIQRWWRRVYDLRSRCAQRIQRTLRRWSAERRYHQLSQHVARPARHLALLLAVARWRCWSVHCQVSERAVVLQRCFRGALGRRRAKERALLREQFRAWRGEVLLRRVARLQLQRLWRGHHARRRCQTRRSALRKLQSALRRRICCKQRRWRKAALLLQRRFRGFRCLRRFQYHLRMICRIQRGFRCWVARRRLAMLQRFEERRRKWLKEELQVIPSVGVGAAPPCAPKVPLKLDEDATTQSSALSERRESEAPDASFSARSAADEMDISIGLIDALEEGDGTGEASRRMEVDLESLGHETFLLAQSLAQAAEARQESHARSVGSEVVARKHPSAAPLSPLAGHREMTMTGRVTNRPSESMTDPSKCPFEAEDLEVAPLVQEEPPVELPLLQHLQDMARTFDALMAGVSSRCQASPLGSETPVADRITGSALRAARRLRASPTASPGAKSAGYAKPTISSTRRTGGPEHSPRKVVSPSAQMGLSPGTDIDHLLRLAYSPSRTPALLRRAERTMGPWRLSNIEPEPWPWDKR